MAGRAEGQGTQDGAQRRSACQGARTRRASRSFSRSAAMGTIAASSPETRRAAPRDRAQSRPRCNRPRPAAPSGGATGAWLPAAARRAGGLGQVARAQAVGGVVRRIEPAEGAALFDDGVDALPVEGGVADRSPAVDRAEHRPLRNPRRLEPGVQSYDRPPDGEHAFVLFPGRRLGAPETQGVNRRPNLTPDDSCLSH